MGDGRPAHPGTAVPAESRPRLLAALVLALLPAVFTGCLSTSWHCRSRIWRAPLARPADAPEPRATGLVRCREIRCHETYDKAARSYVFPIDGGGIGGGGGTTYRFRVMVKGVTPFAPLEVYVSSDGGEFRSLGTLAPNGRGRGRLKGNFDLDASDFIEVRNAAGDVILSGNAPATVWGRRGKAGLLADSRGVEDPAGGARAAVDVLADPGTGRERMRLRLEGLPPYSRLELFLEGEGADRAAEVPVITRRVSGSGEAEVTFDTRNGPALPRGARRVRDLWRRGFRVRVDGETLWEGVVPNLGSEAAPIPAEGDR